MTKPHQDEPFFITDEIEEGLTAADYEFEPPRQPDKQPARNLGRPHRRGTGT
jgi:hypothetical protein